MSPLFRTLCTLACLAVPLWASADDDSRLPEAHNFDAPTQALLGDGHAPWDRTGFASPPYTTSYFYRMEGIVARSITHPLEVDANGDGRYFVAVTAMPRHDGDDDTWAAVVRLGIARKHGDTWEAIKDQTEFAVLPLPKDPQDYGYFRAESFATIKLDGEERVLFTYSYSDGESTPRGSYQVTVLLETPSGRPIQIPWHCVTAYSFSGASLGPIDETTEFSVLDVDHDGRDEITTTTVRTTHNAYRLRDGRYEPDMKRPN